MPRVLRPPLPGPSWLWIPPWPRFLHRQVQIPRTGPDGRRIGVFGIVLVSAGAIMLILSFTTLEWRKLVARGDAVSEIDFAALRQNLEHFPAGGKPGPTVAYFTWLCWVLLIALILVGFAANLPTRRSNGLRLLGFFLGLVGAAFTYYALSRYSLASHDLFGTSSGALDNADLGIWFALGGYLLAGAGSAIGPRQPRRRP
jgi:Na+/proline symporter